MTKATVYLLTLSGFLSAMVFTRTQAQEVQIVDYGIYTGRVVNTFQDSRSPTRRRRALEADLARQTDVIPAILTTKFGLRFRVTGLPEGTTARLRLRIEHPEMTNAATGKVSSSYEALGDCPVGPELLGMYWDFVHEWEMRTGKWTMSIYSGDHLLGRKSLTVVHGKERGERAQSRPSEGEPEGPANGSHPVRSETNSTSSAAGSRR